MTAYVLVMVLFLVNGRTHAEAESFQTMQECVQAESDLSAKIQTDPTIEAALTRCEPVEKPSGGTGGGKA